MIHAQFECEIFKKTGLECKDCADQVIVIRELREELIQVFDQLRRLGHGECCIGGCGFEETTGYLSTVLYNLGHDLFPTPYKGKECFDVISCADYCARKITEGVTELRKEIENSQNK